MTNASGVSSTRRRPGTPWQRERTGQNNRAGSDVAVVWPATHRSLCVCAQRFFSYQSSVSSAATNPTPPHTTTTTRIESARGCMSLYNHARTHASTVVRCRDPLRRANERDRPQTVVTFAPSWRESSKEEAMNEIGGSNRCQTASRRTSVTDRPRPPSASTLLLTAHRERRREEVAKTREIAWSAAFVWRPTV